ncbi:MAG: hypothetical protein OEM26_11065 [Saprospiraceae bacterium]|nr:hypothetical protein [Saprospiraceae bacterium]
MASHEFGRIMSLQVDHLGNLYIVDNNMAGGSIYEMNGQGHIQQLASQLLESDPEPPI